MNTKISFARKLVKYLLLIISNFAFTVVALLSISYFQDVLRAFVWQKNFSLLLSVLIISAFMWITTGIVYLLTE